MAARVLDLSLWEGSLPPGREVSLPGEIGALFVVRGAVASGPEAGQARLRAPGAPIVAETGGADVLVWSLGPAGAGAAGGDSLLELQLSRTLELPAGRRVLRCDRVEFPPGGVAHTHTHRGPGIRRLIAGTFRVWVGEEVRDVPPGGSWFEAGPDPVYAEGSKTEATAFVRVMVLPEDLLGKSSITYVRPEDRDRPKDQRYTIFVDEPIDL
jgi:quercetin dioxygenase-like cupin family protein